MRKGRKVLLIVGIVLAGLVAVIAGVAFSGMPFVRNLVVNPVDLGSVPDGTHAGSFHRGRFSYSVEVTVKDHRIEAAGAGGGKQADITVQQVLGRIVGEQKVNVDTVGGASLTTKAVSKAVEAALVGAAP